MGRTVGAECGTCSHGDGLVDSGLETLLICRFVFFSQAEDGIRDGHVTGVQMCALPISPELLDARTLPLSHDWGYNSEQQFADRTIAFERARVLGGCTAHNGAIQVRGHRRDYDHWVEIGRASCREVVNSPRW